MSAVVSVTLEVGRGHSGALQLSVNANEANGGGSGFRLAGPKFCACHPSEALLIHTLDQRDIDTLRRYLNTAEAALMAEAEAEMEPTHDDSSTEVEQ